MTYNMMWVLEASKLIIKEKMFTRSKDYTWRCDCEAEGSTDTLGDAKAAAKKHLLKNHPDNTNVQVFIDEYSLTAGELTGTYWIMERVFNSISRVKITKHK